MKKQHLLSFVIIFSLLFVSKAQTIQWKKTVGGTANDLNRSIDQTADGGFITAGATLSNNGDVTGNHGSYDFWIVKLDAAGTMQWQKTLGGSGYDFAHCVKQTKDGGYIVAGWSDSNDGDVSGNHGATDVWVVKLSATGTIQWQKTLGGSADEFAYSIHQNSDSTYILAGRTYSTNGDVTSNKGAHDFWVVKLGKTGNLDWQKTYGGSSNDYAQSVAQTFYDGGYIVAGYTSSNNGDVTGNHGVDDSWVLKLDGNGNIQWKKTMGGTGNDYARNIYQTGDQGFVIVGETESNDGDVSGNNGLTDCWVVKLDVSGTMQWQKTLGTPRTDIGLSIQQASDNGYLVGGWSDSIVGDHGAADYWLMKLDPSGTIMWQAPYGGTASDFGYCVDITADGGFVVSGNTNSTNGDVSGNQGLHDFWIIKFNGLPLTQAENSLKLLNVSPNPSTGKYSFANISKNSSIEIYDVTGRIILKELISTNIHTIDLTHQNSGIYFYKISGEKTTTGKLIKQ